MGDEIGTRQGQRRQGPGDTVMPREERMKFALRAAREAERQNDHVAQRTAANDWRKLARYDEWLHAPKVLIWDNRSDEDKATVTP